MTGRSDRENLHRILLGLGAIDEKFSFEEVGIIDVQMPITKALAWFEELFGAMHDAGGEEAAKQGWAMLYILTISLAGGVNATADDRYKEPRRRGGKQPKIKWEDEPRNADARSTLLAMLAKNPKAKVADVMEALRQATGDLRVTEVTLRNAIKRIKGN